MSDYILTDTELASVANAIRSKGGTSAPIEWPDGFVSAIQAIPEPGPKIVPWSTGTDEEIVAMIQAAHAGTIDLQTDGGWAVGDVRRISVLAFTGGSSVAHVAQDVDIVISSFDDYNNCGCVMQFDFKDCLIELQQMNDTNTTVGGYGACEMKTVTLPALVNALPEWLKNILIEFSCLTAAGNGSSAIVSVTGNKLALRSEIEIFGARTYSYAGEGAQIPYYVTASKVKKLGISGSNHYWSGRSPHNTYTSWYCFVSQWGSPSSNIGAAVQATGVSPFGCI